MQPQPAVAMRSSLAGLRVAVQQPLMLSLFLNLSLMLNRDTCLSSLTSIRLVVELEQSK